MIQTNARESARDQTSQYDPVSAYKYVLLMKSVQSHRDTHMWTHSHELWFEQAAKSNYRIKDRTMLLILLQQQQQ